MVNKEIINRMDARMPTAKSLEETRDMLMGAVIETSRLTDYVGDDVMGVILDKQTDTISTHFRRADPQRQAELLEQVAHVPEEFKRMASVSTPYVLTPGMIYGPSIGNPGGWAMNSGITFNFTGFEDDQPGPGGGYFAGQPRKPEPE